MAFRKGHPELAAFLAEGAFCAVPAVAAFLLAFAVCSSRQRSLILVALPSFRTASFMHRACAALGWSQLAYLPEYGTSLSGRSDARIHIRSYHRAKAGSCCKGSVDIVPPQTLDQTARRQPHTLRPAMATTDRVSAKGVRCSSLMNWLSWEWVRLQKKICLRLGTTSSSSSSVLEPSLLQSSILGTHSSVSKHLLCRRKPAGEG